MSETTNNNKTPKYTTTHVLKQTLSMINQGAEARVYHGWMSNNEDEKEEKGRVEVLVKERFVKKYRHERLDKQLNRRRINNESRNMVKCANASINVPKLYFTDKNSLWIVMQYMHGITVKEYLNSPTALQSNKHLLCQNIGSIISNIHHSVGLVHGDLTTSNILLLLPSSQQQQPDIGSLSVSTEDICFIDFGLSFSTSSDEDKAVDLYVMERAMLSTHPNSKVLFQALLDSYQTSNPSQCDPVMNKFEKVRMRGRKRSMVG